MVKLGKSQADHRELMHALILNLPHRFALQGLCGELRRVSAGVLFGLKPCIALACKESIGVLVGLLRTCRRSHCA